MDDDGSVEWCSNEGTMCVLVLTGFLEMIHEIFEIFFNPVYINN